MLCAIALFLTCVSATAADKPNVVVIMTDNHGAWTLGCYGNKEIRTPHIDRLAQEGTLFTRAFASNPVCSPTRATFLTGLIPSQHGVHCFLTAGGLQVGPDARSTLDQFTSLPEVLRDAGYACGLVGKWHLGDNLHPQEGFDDYWITMPHGGTSTFYDAPIIENGAIRNEPKYLTDVWTEHAVKFIEQNAEGDKPFFLFLAYNGPYALGRLLLRDGQNRHAEYYANQSLPSFPRQPAHPWQYNNLDFINNPTSIRRVATEVSGVDDGVGSVMQALKERGLDENTIVIFLADQGWSGGHGGFFGMGDHTRPVTAREDMMRIPLIWRHPGRIAAGATSDRMIANYDCMPTLLGYLGLEDLPPQEPISPGRDFSEVLTASDVDSAAGDQAIFYEFEGLRCIRTERWKYVHRYPSGPHELFDLASDPAELDNLVHVPDQQQNREQLWQRLDAFYSQYALPKYDLWRGGGSQTRVFTGIDEETAQTAPVPPPTPLVNEAFVPPSFQVPEGFTVELAAGPPLVEHPTFATFDDQGRLFVCENAGVNMTAAELEESLPNSIRLLEDSDGDGKFDRSTVFADKLTFPMGGAWHDGALYVASPPNIWRLADTDGDGVADQRDVLVSKFGYTGNAASIHGCVSGPDGRLYWCDGYHGHEFRDASGAITSQREGSYIFSCRPDGSDVTIHCGGGMDNPVEVDFTDEGEMLGTVNIMYTRPRADCLVHWLYGGAYPHREKILSEIKVTGDFLTPMHSFGHVAVSGMLRYRSGLLDYRWRDNIFTTFFNSGRVVRVQLERDGASFKATQREFLSCASRDFHPTDIAEDADGSLLVVDTGGWFYRGCPTSQYAKPDVLGAIYRIRQTGMIEQLDPRGKHIDWVALSNSQLVTLLGDTRFAVRDRAIVESAARGSAIVSELRRALESRDIRYRLGALWALTRIVGEQADPAAAAAVRIGLADQHVSIQLAACRGIAIHPDAAALDALLKLLEQADPAVRREAAVALGRIGNARAVPQLLDALNGAIDRTLEHSIIYALIEINDPASTRAGLDNDNTHALRGAVLALDQMDAGDLRGADVLELLGSRDAELRRVAIDLFCRHPQWSPLAAEGLLRVLQVSGGDDSANAGLQKLLASFLTQPRVAALIGEWLSDPAAPASRRKVVLSALAVGNANTAHASWIEPLKVLLTQDEPETLDAALAAIGSLKPNPFLPQLNQIAADPKRPTLMRVQALQVAEGRGAQLSDPALKMLIGLLTSGSGDGQRAAQIVGASSLSPKQLVQLAPYLRDLAPSQLRELLRPFERASDAAASRAFLAAMQQARGFIALTPPEFSDVIKRFPQELLPEANELLERLLVQEGENLAKLDRLMPLLAEGDAERGREIFFAEKSKCAACHRHGKLGGTIGPELTHIGANRSPRDLLESIVLPSASIVRDYEPTVVVTQDGQLLSGVIARETSDTLYLQQQTGEPIAIAREEIADLVAGTVSIMPSGVDQALTESELADVVAFLSLVP